MSASGLPDQHVELAAPPLAAHQLVSCPSGENLEINLSMQVGGDHVDCGSAGKPAHGLPAAHQGLGTQQPAGVDLAVGVSKILWTDGRRLFIRR